MKESPTHLAVQRSWLAILLTAFLFFIGRSADAHELEVDHLSVRIDSNSTEFSGQFFLDPELTRPGAPMDSLEAEQARVITFIKRHVRIHADERVLSLDLDVRELYEKGGAVPGDSIVFKGRLPRPRAPLQVSIQKPLEKLATTVTRDGTQEPTVLVVGSVKSPLSSPALQDEKSTEHLPEPPVVQQIIEYVWIGFLHIVPLGWDHILFVLALTMGTLGRVRSRKCRALLLELSAFTLAHTATLALGSLKIVAIPPELVEPLIALSIAAMAAERFILGEGSAPRILLVTFFGLVHGLGFAGALHELGLSGSRFLVFLGSFNVGVELGQLVVVLATASCLRIAERWPKARALVLRLATVAVVLVGVSVGIWRICGQAQLCP